MTLHYATPQGFVTWCGKDMDRVRWTKLRGEVTCRKCGKLMEKAGA
jgi:hypothetical protein